MRQTRAGGATTTGVPQPLHRVTLIPLISPVGFNDFCFRSVECGGETYEVFSACSNDLVMIFAFYCGRDTSGGRSISLRGFVAWCRDFLWLSRSVDPPFSTSQHVHFQQFSNTVKTLYNDAGRTADCIVIPMVLLCMESHIGLISRKKEANAWPSILKGRRASTCRLGADHYYNRVRSGVPITHLLYIYSLIFFVDQSSHKFS